jgi:multidrug resistance efflux pump
MKLLRSPMFLWGLLVFLVVLVTLAAINWLFTAGTDNRALATQGPRRNEHGPDANRLVLTGEVDLEHGIALLYPLQTGRVETVFVSDGQHVEGGAPLLRLNDELARALRDQARADLRAARAQLDEAERFPARLQSKIAQQEQAIKATQARLDAARHQLNQARELNRNDLLGQDQLGAAEDQVKALEAMLEAEREQRKELDLIDPTGTVVQARALVAAKRGQLDQAKFAVEETALRAPTAGTVLRLNVRAGDVLSSQPTEPAVLFAADEDLVVRLDVEQEFAEQLRVGNPALVEDAIHPRGSRTGHIRSIAGVYLNKRQIIPTRLPFTTESRTVECIVVLEPGEPPFRIGQEVRVTVQLDETITPSGDRWWGRGSTTSTR